MTRQIRVVSLVLFVLVAVLQASCGAPPPADEAPEAAVETPPPPPLPPVNERLHHGIDVSDHSGAVDWREVQAEGHTFAFVKATEGVDLADPTFAEHWGALKEVGIVRGAYHFYVTEDDPEEQARFFIDHVVLEPGDLVPVVDVELVGHGTASDWPEDLLTFLGILEDHYGVKPIIYTSPKFWNEHVRKSLGEHPLWIAEYEVESPSLPEGWSDWHLWQWQGDATVKGVEKGADLSRVNRGGIDLSVLVVPGPSSGL